MKSIDEIITERVRVEVARQIGVLQATTTTRHITIATAAREADAAPDTVRRWIREGLIVATGEGRRTRVDRESLQAFLSRPRRARPVPANMSPEQLADAHAARGR